MDCVSTTIELETSWTRRIIVAGLLLFAFALLTIAVRGGTNSAGGTNHPAVERLDPLPGAQSPSQARAGIDLIGGWDAELTIDGVAIPLDELDRWDPKTQTHVNPLFELFFTPGPGKVFERFPQGEVCVTADIFEIVNPTNTAVVDWCFSVV
jgi:hypothetical protein